MSHPVSPKRLRRATIGPEVSVGEAIAVLDRAGTGALLICDKDNVLVGMVTDGDIRRAILNGVPMDRPCTDIAARSPLTAGPEAKPSEILNLMDHGRQFLVNHIPIVDHDGRAVDLWLRSDIKSGLSVGLTAVVMAGGKGQRMRPLTEDVPKPMLPVGDRPLLEHIIGQLRKTGIRKVNVTTHYRPERIKDYFGDGEAHGVELNYVTEDRPLGTAGAIGLVDAEDEPILVINGDILTRVDFRALVEFHKAHRADLTVCVRKYDVQVAYGVIECDGVNVKQVREKPVLSFFVNAGIYLLEPSVQKLIPKEKRFDMTDLIELLLGEGRTVVSFPIVEYWLDVGQPEDYEKAQRDIKLGGLDP